ncbi:hypothetical protein [Dyadobacter tibetensis]|uniref:hypothetical protein n=1 Tax=Dyadobacter tibetensis TaxID=1211851 RepID=UPI0004714B26|nr:hypothetical protein [Dyadobacter tibetensis]
MALGRQHQNDAAFCRIGRSELIDAYNKDCKVLKLEFSEWLASATLWTTVQLADDGPVSWYRIETRYSQSMVVGWIEQAKWENSPFGRNQLVDHIHPYLFRIRQSGQSAVLIWEDQWLYNSWIIQSRILALMGISHRVPARLTKARRIDKAMARKFLEDHHLQGSTVSKYQFGLFLPESYFRVLPDNWKDLTSGLSELILAVATFSHVRVFNRANKPHRSFELIRFANLMEFTIVGGLGKLLKAFQRDVGCDDIMTYADLDWSDGKSYLALGFEPHAQTPPMAFDLVPESGKRRLRLADNTDTKGEVEEEGVVWNAGSLKLVKSC